MSVDKFIQKPLSENMKQEAPDHDIVMSTRVRLARNLKDLPFQLLITDSQAEEVIKRMEETLRRKPPAFIKSLELIRIDPLSPLERKVLVEKHLISPFLAEEARKGAVILSDNEEVSIMLNEEDHIRIQTLLPGFQLEEAWEHANLIDDWIEEEMDYAFDDRRGYLTSCPTNTGAGIRASVMLHLPALVMTKQINRILGAVNQVGLVVRGVYGEGSEAQGNLFQISNQITLGLAEEEIIDNLRGVVRQIIDHERAAREMLKNSMPLQLADRIYRSFGLLRYARSMETKEATSLLSDVLLGVDLGLIEGIPSAELNELWVMIQPGYVQTYFAQPMTAEERDEKRATLIREQLQKYFI
ncbi:protein tyrosine kinase [[Clostridium] ultunense Esp]|uniref:protein arginine kinase n=1 Tax=Thermicanus aegyptius TaxID=94009 RepID=UPI0002B6FAC1|nr:protein arginine kinase [Thermicanus aegyptius]CCQ93788.1 protein tyrosine kinase [[Clostridium] ultunense Esp]